MMTVLNSVRIAHSRKRVFIFSGIKKLSSGTLTSTLEEGVLMDLLYIYNVTGSQILILDYQFPFAFTHLVIDIVSDFIFIIMLSFNDFLENRQMSIIPLNIVQQKFERSYITINNSTQARLHVADYLHDTELTGIIYQNSSFPNKSDASDIMLVYNMTYCRWTDTVNLVTDASVNNFAFSKEGYSNP
ncbi:8959_t:CDS:2 [Cetraspora pellucida]|uniref:8959_t:CDS:1 n=1 Tax=Cetraspora pellucida TaxID=1433469 RepID=A0A9N9NFY3_9GLOM|nr:8959_t:CDS:2 [Cetraspora pellucida]